MRSEVSAGFWFCVSALDVPLFIKATVLGGFAAAQMDLRSALLLNPSAGGSQRALLMSSGVGFQSERK